MDIVFDKKINYLSPSISEFLIGEHFYNIEWLGFLHISQYECKHFVQILFFMIPLQSGIWHGILLSLDFDIIISLNFCHVFLPSLLKYLYIELGYSVTMSCPHPMMQDGYTNCLIFYFIWLYAHFTQVPVCLHDANQYLSCFYRSPQSTHLVSSFYFFS